MARILKGKPVADDLSERTLERATKLREKGIVPTLAILRVGENESDLSYERGALKRAEKCGVEVRRVVLPSGVGTEEFYSALDALNNDGTVHGILMFRPLPEELDNERARKSLKPEKDVDGCTDGSMAAVYAGAPVGFVPCTAEAVMAILDYYGIDVKGKDCTVVGNSLVTGRPIALQLLLRDATVSVTHIFTKDVPAYCRRADIVISAAGKEGLIGAGCLREGQTVIDVGINWSEEKGKIVGDCDFETAEQTVEAVTPVPGGVGSVTSAVLISHVVTAAERTLN